MIDNFFSWVLGLSRIQLMLLGIAVVIFCVVVYYAKRSVKLIVVGVVFFGCLLYFGLVTPEQLKTSAEALSDKITSQEVISISLVSDKVRIEDATIQFCIGGTWYCLDDVSRLRISPDGVYFIEVDGSELEVDDANVQKLIDALLKSNDNDSNDE